MSRDEDDAKFARWAEQVRAVQPEAAPVPPPAPAPATHDQRRSRRKRTVRARTVDVDRLTWVDVAVGAALYPEQPGVDYHRPTLRLECEGTERPCPFVSCHYHLYLDVSRSGNIKLNFPDLEVWELAESCALDVADRGGATLEEVGATMNITRERVRQLEVRGLAHLELADKRHGRALHGHVEDEGYGRRRRLPVIQADESDDREGEDEDAE